MATKSTEPASPDAPTTDAKNPSGASEEQLKKGEMTGKVRGPDVDTSFHATEFTDPLTGEPVETHQVIHDVAVGVNEDGSLKTEKGDKVYAVPAEGGDDKVKPFPNQGESGEKGEKK